MLPICSRRNLLKNFQSLVLCYEDAVLLDFLPLVPLLIARQNRHAVVSAEVAIEVFLGRDLVCKDLQADLVAAASRLALLAVVLLLNMYFNQHGRFKFVKAKQTNRPVVNTVPLCRVVVMGVATTAMRFQAGLAGEIAFQNLH